VADALNGGPKNQNCSVAPNPNLLAHNNIARVKSYPLPTEGAVYYVATDGSPAGDGSALTPWGSIEQAVARIREMRQKQEERSEAVVLASVVLRAGTHFLDGTLQLGPRDSHIHFQAFPGEAVYQKLNTPSKQIHATL
jgi:hypothetical protein